MARPKRATNDELTPKERLFAEYICTGTRIPIAYQQAGYKAAFSPDGKPTSASYAKAKEPRIVLYQTEWLKQRRISDLTNQGEAVSGLLQDVAEAREDRNWTAMAAFRRLHFQAVGIAEKHQVQVEHSFTDMELLTRIVGGSAERLKQPDMSGLAALLSPESFDEPEVLELEAEKPKPK